MRRHSDTTAAGGWVGGYAGGRHSHKALLLELTQAEVALDDLQHRLALLLAQVVQVELPTQSSQIHDASNVV